MAPREANTVMSFSATCTAILLALALPACSSSTPSSVARSTPEEVTRDKELIVAAVQKNRSRLSRCDEHSDGGLLEVSLTVDAMGAVSRTRVLKSTFAEQETVDCLLRELHAIEFPELGREVVATLPLEFPSAQWKLSGADAESGRAGEIPNVVRSVLPELTACRGASTTSGVVVVVWTIEPTGSVSDARIKSTTLETSIAACVVNVVARLTFKPSDQAASVSFPFAFAEQ